MSNNYTTDNEVVNDIKGAIPRMGSGRFDLP